MTFCNGSENDMTGIIYVCVWFALWELLVIISSLIQFLIFSNRYIPAIVLGRGVDRYAISIYSTTCISGQNKQNYGIHCFSSSFAASNSTYFPGLRDSPTEYSCRLLC